MKMGTAMRDALKEAQKLGATFDDSPRKKTLDVRFPSGRKERVMKRDRVASRNLLAAIKAENRLQSGPPAPKKPRQPENRAKAKESPAAPRNGHSVRHTATISTRRPALHHDGEIVVARIFSGGHETTKMLVILEAGASQHVVVGLTTLSHYPNGESRHPVPDPASCGLRSSMYLWSARFMRLPRIDVLGHVGPADASLWKLIKEVIH